MLLESIPTVEDCHGGLGSRTGLPDSPSLEMEIARAFPTYEPSKEELDAEYAQHMAGVRPADWSDVACRACGAAIFVQPGAEPICTRCLRAEDDGDDPTSPAGAMFPEVVTWSDEHLITAIELADRREPGLNLAAVGNLPDRYDQLLHECSAELVERLETRQGFPLAA